MKIFSVGTSIRAQRHVTERGQMVRCLRYRLQTGRAQSAGGQIVGEADLLVGTRRRLLVRLATWSHLLSSVVRELCVRSVSDRRVRGRGLVRSTLRQG